ncbi:MFS transporter [Staphylococcus americanisciuri]|uniref:MFS transporter n=1 Tax=Staphylococcus americanisciuri TaxID=2973940 RepID=A0ABT2F3A6_9STAP|nr:MFS transporter [Staphylococcus americanisciuri]MCS4486949.1 MFS transporter [Staphylococcus americanisciuri]
MDNKRLTNLFISFNTLVISGIALFSPILYIFLVNLGYSYTEAGIYLSVFWGVSAICEFPTGVLADTIGQKRLLVYSCILRALGLLFIITDHFILLIVSGILTGAAEAMLSGSLSSWYMNQIENKDTVNLDKVFSRASLFSALFSLIIGFVSAEFLFKVNILLPIIISVGFFIVLGIIIYMFLPEKNIYNIYGLNEEIKNVSPTWRVNLKRIVALFITNKPLILILLVLVIPSILDIGPSNQWQVSFNSQLGYMWIAISLIGIMTNWLIPKIPRFGSELKEIMTYIMIDSVVIFLITITNMSVIFFMIHIVIFTITSVRITVCIHKRLVTNDKLRSSFVSAFYTIEAIVTMSLLPLNGYITEIHNVFYAWNVFIGISIVLLVFCIILILRKNKYSNFL